MKLSDNLKRIRKENNLSQEQLAEKLGVSKNSVSKKMNCQTEFSQADIIKWSMLLNVHKDEYGEYFFT